MDVIDYFFSGLFLMLNFFTSFYSLSGLSFWRHPFTAEDPLNKWCNACIFHDMMSKFTAISFFFVKYFFKSFIIKSVIFILIRGVSVTVHQNRFITGLSVQYESYYFFFFWKLK